MAGGDVTPQPSVPRGQDCHTFPVCWTGPYGAEPTCSRCQLRPVGKHRCLLRHHGSSWADKALRGQTWGCVCDQCLGFRGQPEIIKGTPALGLLRCKCRCLLEGRIHFPTRWPDGARGKSEVTGSLSLSHRFLSAGAWSCPSSQLLRSRSILFQS